jgi:hypothetical protein
MHEASLLLGVPTHPPPTCTQEGRTDMNGINTDAAQAFDAVISAASLESVTGGNAGDLAAACLTAVRNEGAAWRQARQELEEDKSRPFSLRTWKNLFRGSQNQDALVKAQEARKQACGM